MEKDEFRRNAEDMIYLTVCAVKGQKPDMARVGSVDLPKLFEVCQKHILTACVAYALDSAGVKDDHFTQAKEKAVRKNILLDTERRRILQRLEAEKIWYMPLKGALLKEWYPKLGMRQMSDNDILCDGTKRAYIKELMLDMGFTCNHFGKGNDDAYFKPPVCNFEMHNELFTAVHIGNLYNYYDDVKNRLIKDTENEYGYHFSNEDFYIYLIAHEYRHFTGGGTGVRSLVDTYVFMQRFRDKLDLDYINDETQKLGIAEFERSNRELAEKIFAMKTLSSEDKELLDYYIMSGTYGNMVNRVKNDMKRQGNGSKSEYLRYRFFPPIKYLEASVPWAKKSKLLIPFAYIFRLLRGVKESKKKVAVEFKQLGKEK